VTCAERYLRAELPAGSTLLLTKVGSNWTTTSFLGASRRFRRFALICGWLMVATFAVIAAVGCWGAFAPASQVSLGVGGRAVMLVFGLGGVAGFVWQQSAARWMGRHLGSGKTVGGP